MNLVNDWTDVNSKIKLIQMLICKVKTQNLFSRKDQSMGFNQQVGSKFKKGPKKGQQVKFEIQNIFDNYIKMKQRLVLKVCVMVKFRNNC